MKIIEPIDPEVKVALRGLRKDASTLSSRNVQVELDLSLARFGKRIFRITRNQIVLAYEKIHVVRIEPPQIEFKFEETPHPAKPPLSTTKDIPVTKDEVSPAR